MKNAVLFNTLLVLLLTSCQAKVTAESVPTVVQSTSISDAIATSLALSTAQNRPSTQDAPPGCTVISPQPTPGPTEQSIFPAVGESEWIRGPLDADVTLIEYGDFQ